MIKFKILIGEHKGKVMYLKDAIEAIQDDIDDGNIISPDSNGNYKDFTRNITLLRQIKPIKYFDKVISFKVGFDYIERVLNQAAEKNRIYLEV